ncbi:hypothetical protein Q3G72_001846 [Acer saccharum]|nr:hypothetical protein Q3G72_001846 [Acer saccharum]
MGIKQGHLSQTIIEGFMELLSIFPNLTKGLLKNSKEMCNLLNIELEDDSDKKITKEEMHSLDSTLECLDDSIVYTRQFCGHNELFGYELI